MTILHIVATLIVVLLLLGEWMDYLMMAQEHWSETARIWVMTAGLVYVLIDSWVRV